MKKMILASVAALAVSTPAFAQDFTGPRVGATIGLADDDFAGTEVFTYGVNAGYDFKLGGAIVGGTVEYQDSSEDGVGRDLSAVARVGGKISNNALLYGLAGYSNLGIDGTGIEIDGARFGAGAEVAVAKNVYGQFEYRYTNYQYGLELHQMVLGLGVRF